MHTEDFQIWDRVHPDPYHAAQCGLIQDRLAALPWSKLQAVGEENMPAAFAALARFVGAFSEVATSEELVELGT
eukprot:4893889-Amphidinium_carterae.1